LRRRKAFSLVILAVLALTGCEPWQRSITRASETLRGDAANGTYAGDPSLSRDGGVVAFRSDATNLVAGDTNGQPTRSSELLGRTWCDDAVGGTDLCDQHYVRFDDDVDTIGRHTICHETGHAVGLTHGAEADPVQRSDNPSLMGCMSTAVDPGNEAGTESLGNQNFDMIKAIYPLPGANEHD